LLDECNQGLDGNPIHLPSLQHMCVAQVGCKHAVRNEWRPCADSRRRRPQRLRERGQWASWRTTSVCPHESPLYSTTCTVHGLLHCVQKCMASRRGRGASAEGGTRAPWKRQCREACRQEEAPPWRQRARGHAVCVSSQAYSVCVCPRPQCVPGNQASHRELGPMHFNKTPLCCGLSCVRGARVGSCALVNIG